MRMSCNGCRVLRKGCSENCTIRPCLLWIQSPESQANATVFLAKFYGRAGLLNLINAGPDPLRPAIFRSLLYEACGRIVNPVYGSAGLLLSGSWHLCQAAVEAVLSGAPIVQVSSESAAGGISPPLKACDIRHVFRDDPSSSPAAAANLSQDLRRVAKTRTRFKRSTATKLRPKPNEQPAAADFFPESTLFNDPGLLNRDPGGQPSQGAESDSVSVETVEASLVKPDDRTDGSDVELELTLGFEPPAKTRKVSPVMNGLGNGTCKEETAHDLLA